MGVSGYGLPARVVGLERTGKFAKAVTFGFASISVEYESIFKV